MLSSFFWTESNSDGHHSASRLLLPRMASLDPDKLLERMRRSPKGGWGQDDIGSLLRGFGFSEREGSNHRLYKHPKLPGVRVTVGRHNDLAVGYVLDAIRAVHALKLTEEEHEDGNDESR